MTTRSNGVSSNRMYLKRHLSYAQGYLELGLVDEAAAELEQIPPDDRKTPEVVAAWMAVLQEQCDWAALAAMAGEYVRQLPAEPAGWVTWAYATRRSDSLEAAEKILCEAERHHPHEATIQFNLGCYACVRGDLEEARRHVTRAIVLEPKFRGASETDPDLAALRAAGETLKD